MNVERINLFVSILIRSFKIDYLSLDKGDEELNALLILGNFTTIRDELNVRTLLNTVEKAAIRRVSGLMIQELERSRKLCAESRALWKEISELLSTL